MSIPTKLGANVSVTRLHNLGDYEHAKYEVTLVAPASQAGDVVNVLDSILRRMKPVREPYNLAAAERVLAAGPRPDDAEDCDCSDMSFKQAKAIVDEHRANVAIRQQAIDELNALGATLEGKL